MYMFFKKQLVENIFFEIVKLMLCMATWLAKTEDRGIAKFCDRKILSYKLRIAEVSGNVATPELGVLDGL